MWNRDKCHIIWRAKNLIKNAKKRTIEYISQPQSKASTWNYTFHVTVHLPSNCYQTRTQPPLSCNKQMTQLAIRQKLYIYIYIYFIVISKKNILFYSKKGTFITISAFYLVQNIFTNDYLQNKKHNLSRNYDFRIILFQKLTILLKFIKITTPYMFWQKIKSKNWS